jgi:hypothetical protein
MADADFQKLLGVVQTFLSWRGQVQPHDLADLFSLLGRLDQDEKQAFWAWLGVNAPNVRKWLMAKGSESRRAA